MLAVIRQFRKGRRVHARKDTGKHSNWFDVTQGLIPGINIWMRASTFAVKNPISDTIRVGLARFIVDEDIVYNVGCFEEDGVSENEELILCVWAAVWGMLSVDDALSRSWRRGVLR